MKIVIDIEDGEEVEEFTYIEHAIEYLKDVEARRKSQNNIKFIHTYIQPEFKQRHSVSKKDMFLNEILYDLKELGYVCTYEGATGYTYEKILTKKEFKDEN